MRILINSFGSFGDINPYLGLARVLKARGHEPTFATSEHYREFIEREGVRFHAVRPHLNPNDRALVGKIMDPVRGTELLLRNVAMPSLRDALEDSLDAVKGMDVIVTHPLAFAAVLLAEKERIPWVSTVLAPLSFFSEFDLPVFPPVPWLRHLAGVPGVPRFLTRLARNMSAPWVREVAALRRELSLPQGGHPLMEGQHSAQCVLALFSPLLGKPQADWPPNVTVTGAIPYNDAQGTSLSPEIESFLNAGPPPIIFTLGTGAVSAAGTFYEESARATRVLKARAILMIGRHEENRPKGPLGDDTLLVDVAPHALLLPHASVIVHSGGIGTTHQALRAGKPTLVVPHAHDQPDNAWRVEKLGVSRTLSARAYRSATATLELSVLLNSHDMRARAAEVAAEMRLEDGARVACEKIEEIGNSWYEAAVEPLR